MITEHWLVNGLLLSKLQAITLSSNGGQDLSSQIESLGHSAVGHQ